MAKPGRKPLAMPRKPVTVYIREDLLAKLELLLLDPMRDRSKYGSRTEYFEGLIERDLKERSLVVQEPETEQRLEPPEVAPVPPK